MGTLRPHTRSAAALAASRALDMEIELTRQGREPRFPDRTTIVASDLATPELIAECHGRGKPVVVVDERGGERFLPVP